MTFNFAGLPALTLNFLNPLVEKHFVNFVQNILDNSSICDNIVLDVVSYSATGKLTEHNIILSY